jgi:accessory gene regulator protein AgrB
LLIAQFGELVLWFTLVALLVFGLAYALRPAEAVGRHVKETILAFVAFYFLLLGLRFMVGPITDTAVLLGDLFASLALTFFWLTRKK